jgi:hypothetical protein
VIKGPLRGFDHIRVAGLTRQLETFRGDGV